MCYNLAILFSIIRQLSKPDQSTLQELTICRLLYRELQSPIRTRVLQIQANTVFCFPESFSRSRSVRPAPNPLRLPYTTSILGIRGQQARVITRLNCVPAQYLGVPNCQAKQIKIDSSLPFPGTPDSIQRSAQPGFCDNQSPTTEPPPLNARSSIGSRHHTQNSISTILPF